MGLKPLRPGTSVLLAGTVLHQRDGFVTIKLDSGGPELVVWRTYVGSV